MAHRGRHMADEALAAGRTAAEAALEAKVSVRTVERRKAEPEFARRVRELQFEMVRAASGRLSEGLAEAVEVIRELLKHADPNVRLRAATRVVDLSVKVFERVEREHALADLQAKYEELKERLSRPEETAP